MRIATPWKLQLFGCSGSASGIFFYEPPWLRAWSIAGGIKRLFAQAVYPLFSVLNDQGVDEMSINLDRFGKEAVELSPKDTQLEEAVVEITREQLLGIHFDEVVDKVCMEGMDADPTFYRPFERIDTARLIKVLPSVRHPVIQADIRREVNFRATAES